MGCCISKSRSSSKVCDPIQDKRVISPDPSLPLYTEIPKKRPLSPPPSCTPTGTSSSSVTSSSCTSSSSSVFSTSSTSKDGAFSNEFLWACIKENPQIIQIDPSKLSPIKPSVSKFSCSVAHQRPSKVMYVPGKQSIPRCQPLKKARSSSPILARQKCFRKESERTTPVSLSRRNLGSPSPSRRFNGDACQGVTNNQCSSRRFNGDACRGVINNQSPSRRFTGEGCGVRNNRSPGRRFSGNAVNHIASRKENIRPMSPSNMGRHGSCPKKREMGVRQIHQQVDENAVMEDLSIDSVSMEDLSLDCFIFL